MEGTTFEGWSFQGRGGSTGVRDRIKGWEGVGWGVGGGRREAVIANTTLLISLWSSVLSRKE